MSSFRNYNDAGAYRTRIGISSSSTFGRSASTGNSFGNYRSSYTGIGSSSLRTSTTKDRSIGNVYTTNYTRKDGDKVDEKPSYKYSFKSSDKDRLTPGKLPKDEPRTRSRSINSSVLEKYKIGSGKLSSERSTSALDKYRGSVSRETSREPDSASSRYGSSNSYSESSRSYGVQKKDRDHELISYRGMRAATTRVSRESSPEMGSKNPANTMYSRTPTFGKNANSSNATECTSISSPSKYNGAIANGRRSHVSQANPECTSSNPDHEEPKKSESSPLRENIPSPRQSLDNESRLDKTQKISNGSETNAENKRDETKDVNGEDSTRDKKDDNVDDDLIIISVVTRGTSPTPPPPLTAYTRTRRLDPIPKPVKREIKKSQMYKIITREQEQQVEYEYKENSVRDRYCRYGNSSNGRTFGLPWVSSYLDKFSSPPSTGSSSSYGAKNNRNTPNGKGADSYPRATDNASSSKIQDRTSPASNSSRDTNHHNRCSSSSSSSSTSKESNLRTSVRSPHQKPARNNSSSDSENRKTDAGREESPRIVEGQDHGQGSGSRKESLSKSSDVSSCSSQGNPGSGSRSGCLKLRQATSPQTPSPVSLPVGCSGGGNVGGGGNIGVNVGGSGKSASSTSSAATATAASMTKIKSVASTTAAALPSSNGKCATISAGPSVTSRRASSPDARDRKPPVPKSEMVGKNGAMLGPGGIKYVNKDFRKSALNMENGDPSRSQIADGKHRKKFQRSVSVSSQDSQSESNSGSMSTQPVASSGGSLTSLKSNKSGSKIRALPVKSGSARKNDERGCSKDARRSNSKSPASRNNGNISRTMSVSTSECSFDGSSSESSNRDEEGDHRQKGKSDLRKRRTTNSPFQERKGKTSVDSSRTSILASSADELSINTDKPPRPPSTPRSRSDRSGKTEEAKSFLIRTLAPVTNIYKMKQQENSDDVRNGSWVDACSEEVSDSGKKSQNSLSKSVTQNLSRSPSLTNVENNSSSDRRRTNSRVRRQSSGEKPWWLDSNSDNVPEGVERNPSTGNDDISQDTTISTVLPDDGKFKFKVWRQESGERAWWLDANEDIPEDESTSGRCGSSPSSSRKQRSSPAGRLQHQQSGERAWWLSDDPESVPDGVEVIPVSPVTSPARTFIGRLNRVDSGEKPWWLDSSSNVPEGVKRIPTETSNSNSDSSESFEKVDIGAPRQPEHTGRGLAKFPVDDEPLGDRASPEGIENPPDPPENYGGRNSPYDNVATIRQTPPRRSAPRKRPANLPLFIGNHTNIDDLLGDATGPNRSRKKGFPKDKDMLSDSSDEECEEIDATQVIIHDSTPQTPVIQRRHRDNDRPQPDGYIPGRRFDRFIGRKFLLSPTEPARNKSIIFYALLFTIYVSICTITLVRSGDNPPTVKTPLGTITGFYQTSFKGRKYEIYEGIPYAKPPVGNLRFEEPVPITAWGSLNATIGRPVCAQYIDMPPDSKGNPISTKNRVVGEDDCLYLSVQLPVFKDKSKKLPVIFYIHGGSFQFGSGAPTTLKFKYLADKDVVFVSMNYRLGIQGFLSTEDEVLPGNLGLKDQNLALRWTSENIDSFGGDAKRITLIGCSAGGSSVHYHLLSPLSRGLFHSAIAFSGTAFNPWAFTTNSAEKARKLGAIFKCPTQNSREMIDCLKKVPAQDLAAATKEFQFWQSMPNAPFAPVVEKVGKTPFIGKTPKEILEAKEMADVPIIYGIDKDEGCDPVAGYAPHDNILKNLNDNWLSIAPHLLNYNYTLPIEKHNKISEAVRKEYFGDKPIDKNTVPQLMQMITDEHYMIHIDKGVRLQAAASKNPVYFYYNTFRGSHSYSEILSGTDKNFGTCHCEELLLVIGNVFIDPSKSKKDLEMSSFFINLWESMAYNRTISNIGVEWQPVNPSNSKTNYLQINSPDSYIMSDKDNFGNKNFWNKYLSE